MSIVIPALNEEHGLEKVLAQVAELPLDCEVVVVDDGSSDRTSEIARELGARTIRHVANLGYGRSVKDGIVAAEAEIIALTDADGTYPIERLPDLLDALNRGFDMVVGARQGRYYRGSFLKMPLRIVLKYLVQFTAGAKIPDINSGLRVFRKKDIERHWDDLCDTFSFTTTLTLSYLLTKRTIHYVPIDYRERIGASKIRMVRDSLRTMQYIVRFICRYNPMKLFVLLTMSPLLLGAALGSFVGWPQTMFFASLVAIVVFALGLTVESLRETR